MRCREVLDAETYDMALLPILATKRVCSANFVVGHGDGEIIDIETSPNAVSYLYPVDGLVTHSNHLPKITCFLVDVLLQICLAPF